nr:DUF4097 family beta strand repeat-containing protein [Micromonospora sp. DSM 115978]
MTPPVAAHGPQAATAFDQTGPEMTTFNTPEPIHASVLFGFVCAHVRVTATDRTDTTVDIRPLDPASKADTRIVDQTQIEYADGRLTVRGPRFGSMFSRTGSVEVTVELPTGSQLEAETGVGDVHTEGPLGECRFKTGYGALRIDRTGPAVVRSGSGDVEVDHIGGDADIKAGNGAINVRRIDGAATVKASNGAAWIGEAGGTLKVSSSNGTVTVDRSAADLTARTSNGSLRIGQVGQGTVGLDTAAGSIEFGVPEGTAVWLDLNTRAGRVRNELASVPGPEQADRTVQVRARTSIGDIVVHRA